MKNYRYALIRFVADALRMEPVNVGLVLQDQDKLDFQLNTKFSLKGKVDSTVFNQWRKFLEEEITGDAMPLFQPKKSSQAFFSHLAGLCDGAIRLSEPLSFATEEDQTFDEVLSSLYKRLVAPHPDAMAVEANRPTGRFRQLMKDYDFLRRGMKRHAHVELPDNRRWMPYRHLLNDSVLAIDKIEVSNQIGQTANEIQGLTAPLSLLKDFLKDGVAGQPTEYYLLADTLESRFTDQSEKEFGLMRDDLERAVDGVREAGGSVIRSAPDACSLAERLDHRLPKVATSSSENTLNV